MKLSLFLAIKAAISLFFGILLAIIPVQMLAMYGLALNAEGAAMARLVGALLIGVGLICWLSRRNTPESLQNILLSLFIADTLGFLSTLLSQLTGIVNALHWIIVAIWLLLALGLGYFRFIKKYP